MHMDATEQAMPIEEYLAQGGVLTSPDNVPGRYRGELLRLMASFVDSEMAGSAGFAGTINAAPGLKSRIAAARITLEKTDHAERVLKVMSEFGVDMARYAVHQPWDARIGRDADLGQVRHGGDMRLSVFHYPLQGWIDAVVMNVLQGLATVVTLRELIHVSYAPLASAFQEIAPREAHHVELGFEGLDRIVADREGLRAARASVKYWHPRVTESFGTARSGRFETLKKFGLRHRPNETLLADWKAETERRLAPLGLS